MVAQPAGHGHAPVVVLEFGNEIPPRTFDQILPLEARADRVRIDPLRVPGLTDSLPSPADQARYWAGCIAPLRPAAVLAYCSAADLAALLVAELGGGDVPLVVFDPVLPTPEAPDEVLLDLARGMAGSLEPSEVPHLTGLAPDEGLRRGSAFLRSLIARSAPDLDEDLADELTTGQRRWLAFTLSAAAGRRGPLRLDHVVLSTEAEWSDADARAVHRTGLSSADLFGTGAVTPLVARLLTGERAGEERASPVPPPNPPTPQACPPPSAVPGTTGDPAPHTCGGDTAHRPMPSQPADAEETTSR